jgi:hypothetical protein
MTGWANATDKEQTKEQYSMYGLTPMHMWRCDMQQQLQQQGVLRDTWGCFTDKLEL